MPQSFVPFAATVCGINELPGHCHEGVSHVLSILDPDHPGLAVFGEYGEHERLELRFHDIIDPRDGLVPPQREDVEAILRLGRDLMAEPETCRHLLVHCHMGISRSTAALTMLLAQARPELPAAEAMAAVVSIRKEVWPNLRMIEFADEMLGRGGELVAAVRTRHREYALRRPEMVLFMRENGREREVEGL
ncbi:MAG TPA: protein-tyrosine-phosphatase [Azospirillum sp.]|nr:protein-tyrosine-phosphatase [Azospirillum sp.]